MAPPFPITRYGEMLLIYLTITIIIYGVATHYYGNEKNGIWASKEETINYLINHKCLHIKTIHFSALTYQNWCRNINKNAKSESHRNYIQIKWFSIVSDLQKIRSNNT